MLRSILDRWDFTVEDLTYIIEQNPSLRGIVLGYLAELKFQQFWLNGPRVAVQPRPDDHDRGRPGDRVAIYGGREFVVEVKSLQTNTVHPTLAGWTGKSQVDASDRRTVTFPDGSTLQTTCLLRGTFDILAVNLFAFGEEWRFAFAKNSDLPLSNHRPYTDYQKEHLLATTVTVSWPLEPPFRENLFEVMDDIIENG